MERHHGWSKTAGKARWPLMYLVCRCDRVREQMGQMVGDRTRFEVRKDREVSPFREVTFDWGIVMAFLAKGFRLGCGTEMNA